MTNYATRYDIAERMYRAHPWWFEGKPKPHLEGKEGEFGVLKMDFGDEVVEWKIYVKDRKFILEEAKQAIANFNKLVAEMHDQ